jgi:hypothetical protein
MPIPLFSKPIRRWIPRIVSTAKPYLMNDKVPGINSIQAARELSPHSLSQGERADRGAHTLPTSICNSTGQSHVPQTQLCTQNQNSPESAE